MTSQTGRSNGPIRLLPAVVSDPPFDDEGPGPAVSWPIPWLGTQEKSGWTSSDQLVPRRGWTDGSLALADPLIWRQLTLQLVEPMGASGSVEDADSADDDDDNGPIHTPTRELPASRPAARNYVRALLEVLTGDRPLAQLARSATPQVYAQLEAAGRLAGPRSWAGSVHSVHVSEPADGIAEVAAVVERQKRYHAVALRLEGRDGRWVMTRIRLGW